MKILLLFFIIYLKYTNLITYFQNIYENVDHTKIEDIMEKLPPPFFTPHIFLRKKDSGKIIEIERIKDNIIIKYLNCNKIFNFIK